MNRRKVCFLALYFFCFAAALFGFGNKEEAAKEPEKEAIPIVLPEPSDEEEPSAIQEPKIVQVTGVVRLVGSATFPELIISGPDAEWYVAGEEIDKLKDMQHRTVTVEGLETVIELKFASGRPAGKRRELRDIAIIAVE